MVHSRFRFTRLSYVTILVVAQVCLSPTLDGQTGASSSNPIPVRGKIQFNGQPAPQAEAFLFQNGQAQKASLNQDGSFELKVDSNTPAQLLAVAKGMRSQLRSLKMSEISPQDFQLEKLQEPVRGKIIDNQGMPVANAKLRLLSLGYAELSIPIPGLNNNSFFESETDENGIFEFRGIDKKMVGSVVVTGQGLVTSTLSQSDLENEIVLVAQPARIVKGRVIDLKTGTPIPQVIVSVTTGGQQVQTDERGAFELTGLPAFQPLTLRANSTGNAAYVSNSHSVPVENAFEPVDVEIALKPGVWINCKVSDFSTDGPASAEIFYFPTPENEEFQTYVQSFIAEQFVPSNSTDPTGNAKIVAIAGPGVIAVSASGFPPNESVSQLSDEQRAMLQGITQGRELTAVEWIDPENLTTPLELDFLVSKGRAIDVQLTDSVLTNSDRLIVHRAASPATFNQSVVGTKFAAEQFQPGEVRQILIHAPSKNLGAVIKVKAESESPVEVSLLPTSRIAGQIVNKNGDPQSGLSVQFEIQTENGFESIASPVFTDANGRFEKSSLIPDLEYRIAAVRLTNNQQMMMAGAPSMDSRWYLAENLKVNTDESIEFNEIVLGATEPNVPNRAPRKSEALAKEQVLPSLFSGLVVDATGSPVANATVTFNTWPNQVDPPSNDSNQLPIVLAQSRTDQNGNFEMAIDKSLESRLVPSDSTDGKLNSAIVVLAKKLGVAQFPLESISDSENLEVRMNREMIVRGKVKTNADASEIRLAVGSEMKVYDSKSVKALVAGLESGKSLEEMQREFTPIATVNQTTGGFPATWKTNASGTFLIRNIPLNSVFELHAFTETERQVITVVSRPMRGILYRPTQESNDKLPMQGSRVNFDLTLKGETN